VAYVVGWLYVVKRPSEELEKENINIYKWSFIQNITLLNTTVHSTQEYYLKGAGAPH
jgi:hypothetical protein